MTIIISCVDKDAKGVIITLGFIIWLHKDVKEELVLKGITSKETIINTFKEDDLVTEDGTKVHVVKGKYLRTDGDQNADNDLLDLPPCK